MAYNMFDVLMDDVANLTEDIKRYKNQKSIYQSGTTCPKCQCRDNSVVDSRYINGFQQRRRECISCKYRWNTIEIVEG